jgi:hypothetical protein
MISYILFAVLFIAHIVDYCNLNKRLENLESKQQAKGE